MELKFNNYLRLLVLAYTPETGTSILDWSPFGGDALGKIIDDHNTKCIQSYQKLGWLDELIEALGEGIDIVPHDLSTVTQLRTKEFADINILLIDLEAIENKTTEIEKTKTRMARHEQIYHLPQVSRTPSAASRLTDFQPLAVIPSMPEILLTQEDFERYLGSFCKFYRIALNAIPPTPPPTGYDPGDRRAMQAYVEAVPRIAGNVRDAAMTRDLSEEETVTLARRAAIQEFVLTRLAEQVRTPTTYRVVLDAIREPVVGIPTEPHLQAPSLQQVDLVKFRLTRPMRELTTEQRDVAVGLGIRGKTFAAIHLDQPTTWDTVSRLRDVVKATKFSAKLPVGLLDLDHKLR